jgi:AAA+ ATPase superfamily predicted ATPase
VIQPFSDRERELQFLEDHYETRQAELLVIYGRRRVGKTELCLRFSENKPHIYFLADRRPETHLIQELKKIMSHYLEDESFAKLAINDWIELFKEFTKWNKSEHTLMIVDEFPILIESNRAIPSIFQKIWDQNLKNTHTTLILLGSSVAMMETEVLNIRSPLYGRRTAQWKLEPLQLIHLKPFFPKYNIETLAHVYGCLGGVPAYLHKFNPKLDFWRNVEQKILMKGEFLYQEAEFLLREELREPRNYAAILQAVAQGARNYGEILDQTNMEKSMLSKYVSVLEDLGFIRRIYPLGAKPKPRKGQYAIADNYLGFWFRYLFTNKTELETGKTTPTLNRVREDYNTYMGRAFEDISLEFLNEMQLRQQLPFTYTRIGKWWYRETEIDLIATEEQKREATFIEVKWSTINKQEAQRILNNLISKATEFRWEREKEKYGIIAKNLSEKHNLRDEGYVALDLKDFEQL